MRANTTPDKQSKQTNSPTPTSKRLSERAGWLLAGLVLAGIVALVFPARQIRQGVEKLPVTHRPAQRMAPISVLDEVGLLDRRVPPREVADWKVLLASGRATPVQAALLHVRLGEYALAHDQQPEEAIAHFAQAQQLQPATSRVYGLAAYDAAMATFYTGAYSAASSAFDTLLATRPALVGFDWRSALLWYRHARACSGYHIERARMGIPEPPRLDPNCGAAALAACLRARHLPYDRHRLLSVCRVTGEGSTLADIARAAKKLGVVARVVSADDAGLRALPTPAIAVAEHDHFICVTQVSRAEVVYLCSDCGPWPGGAVHLSWKQFHALEPTLYVTITTKGEDSERWLARVVAKSSHRPAGSAARGHWTLADLGVRVPAPERMRRHILLWEGDLGTPSCGNKLTALHCACPKVHSPMDAPHCGKSGPTSPDPVNLATGEEELQPDADLSVYNPIGPSVSWGTLYDSLRGPDSTYECDDLGVGWSQPYNVGVIDSYLQIDTPIPQGQSGVVASTGNDPCASGLSWDILLGGSSVATSSSPGAWSVTFSTGGPATVGVPSGASVANGYEVRWEDAGSYFSGFFDVIPATSLAQVPQGGSATFPSTGMDAPASGLTWDILNSSSATVATSASPNGWSVTYSSAFTVSAPQFAPVGAYEVYYQNFYTSADVSASFDVYALRYAPATGTKYVFLPNGARISFNAPSIPTAATPVVACPVEVGVGMKVEWDYDAAFSSGYYTITFADRTQWITTPLFVSSVYPVFEGCLLSQIVDKNGLSISFTYSSVGTAGIPLLSEIDDSNGVALLCISRAGDGTGNITGVSDRYGRSVYYHVGTYDTTDVPGWVPWQSYQELDLVSQIVTTGTSSPPVHYAYGYENVSNGDSSETVPFLHTITVPSPTGTGTSTASINYTSGSYSLIGGSYVWMPAGLIASLVDANGNTRSYTAVDNNHTKVTITDAGSALVSSYIAGFDSNLSATTRTDGDGAIVSSAVYADANDPYRPSSIQDGASLYSLVANSSADFASYGSDAPASGSNGWDIVLNGTTVDHSASGGSGGSSGWSVSASGGSLTVTAPSGASVAAHYEVRFQVGTGVYASAFFDAVSLVRPATQFVWDAYGHLHQKTSARGTVTDYTWAFSGTAPSVVNTTTDSSAFVLGELRTVHTSGKAAINVAYYEPSGNVETITSPVPGTQNGTGTVTTSLTYDSLGNVLTITTPGNNAVSSITTTMNYTTDGTYSQSAAIGQPVTITDNLSKTTHLRFDSRGNRTSVTDALGDENDATFNLADQVVQSTAPATGQTGTGHAYSINTYLYVGGPLTSTCAYDESGTKIREADPVYGAEGESLSVSGSVLGVTKTYDGAYRTATVEDANTHTTNYSYNTAGYVSQVSYPGASGAFDTINFGPYDADGRLLKRVDGRSVETDYAYNDAASALTDVKYPATTSLNVSISYDEYGRPTSRTDGTGSQSYAFDDLDSPTSITTSYTGLSDQTVSYGYYADGSRQSMSTPGGDFSYSYDGDGRMSSLTNPFSETSSWNYLDNGWLWKQYVGSAAVTAYTYNARGLMTELATIKQSDSSGLSDFGGAIGSGNEMFYDGVGNRTSMLAYLPASSSYSGLTGYTYDGSGVATASKNQLVQETSARAGSYTNNFSYDSGGNPTSFKGSSHSFNSDNQDTANTFDGNGDPTTYQSTSMSYDAENRLTAIGSSLTAGYTADGLRAWKQNSSSVRTYFIYNGNDPVCELDASGGVIATNTFGANGLLSRHTSSGSVFYTFDPQGNTTEKLTSSGSVVSASMFDAFGTRSTTDTTGDPFNSFGAQAGYYADSETGLQLLGHRYYDAGTGRFINRDPIGYGGGINLYGYAENNPVNMTDPNGLQCFGMWTSWSTGQYIGPVFPTPDYYAINVSWGWKYGGIAGAQVIWDRNGHWYGGWQPYAGFSPSPFSASFVMGSLNFQGSKPVTDKLLNDFLTQSSFNISGGLVMGGGQTYSTTDDGWRSATEVGLFTPQASINYAYDWLLPNLNRPSHHTRAPKPPSRPCDYGFGPF